MKLSSAYLINKLKKDYKITGQRGISGQSAYLRPVFKENKTFSGHIVITEQVICESEEKNFLQIITSDVTIEEVPSSLPYIILEGPVSFYELYSDLQKWFEEADCWQEQMREGLLKGENLQEMLTITSAFLGNPLTVMGQDFSMVAEAGTENIPDYTRIFVNDNVNQNYMSMIIQYKNVEYGTVMPVLYPAFVGGCRTISVNIQVGMHFTHRLVMTEVNQIGEFVDFAILAEFSRYVTYILEHTPAVLEKSGLEDIFLTLLTDRTADYLQVSRKLSLLGWGEKQDYLCLVLKILYQDQDSMTVQGICRYMKKQYPASCSFEFEGDVITFLNLTLLEKENEEIEQELSFFIRDSYLKAGYSRVNRGHMNLRRQYLQAKTAIQVGNRVKPHIWIYRFNQIVLAYLMEQTTEKLPGEMVCHEGVLQLKRMDEEHHSDYIATLKCYLDNNLSATRAANELFIHRSTFLYRLEKIREVLQSQIEDPDEIFYLNYSLRILEMEK